MKNNGMKAKGENNNGGENGENKHGGMAAKMKKHQSIVRRQVSGKQQRRK